MTETLLYGIVGIVGAYVLLRMIGLLRKKAVNTVDREIEDILTKEEYRVKGRFEK